MNRDAAIEAGARTLWVAMRHYPEIDWQEANAQGHPGVKFCRRQSVTVIDAALPHLMGEVVGYLVVPSSGAGYPAYKTLEGASRDLPPGWRVVALIPVVEP